MVQRKKVDNHPLLTNPTLTFIDLTNRRYANGRCIVLSRSKDEFGGLLNMSSAFPLNVNGIAFPSAEHLYQCLRYPGMAHVQQGIIDNRNPLMSKRWSSQFRDQGLAEWYQKKPVFMNWVLHVKLALHYDAIGALLEATGKRTIVETSPDGNFWGAVREIRGDESSALIGANVFGQLLMHLRDEYHANTKKELLVVEPIDVPDFLLLGEPVRTVDCRDRNECESKK